MNPITDEDLVLYRYRDGLDADRVAQIAAALAGSRALRERYAAIEQAVAHFDENEIAPDPDLGARLWRRLGPQLEEAGVIATRAPLSGEGSIRRQPPLGGRLRALLARALLRPALAAAAVLVVTTGVAFLLGRQSVTERSVAASTEADVAAARVLDTFVAANLRATERVLLTASNSGDASLLEGNREVAQSLVESNRLYALAAARAGNTRLADFLRQLEPVLLSLANQPGTAAVESTEDLRRFLDTTDLLFQVRATEARLDRDVEPRT